MQKKKKIIYGVIVLILCAVAFLCYMIYKTLSDNKKIEEEIQKIKDEVIIKIDDTDEEPKEDEPEVIENDYQPEKIVMDFDKLNEINSDTVGWIKINNTNIDYPVVKGNDNSYYLNHSFYKYENVNGWIFLNSDNSSDFSDENSVIFGHNTNSYTMFSELRDIYKGNLGTSIYVYIYTEKGALTYQVFSVYLENPKNTANISKYTNQSLIDDMKSKSKLDIDVQVTEEDKILTLSTCNNVTNDRLILHAKKL